ncbi:moonshiner [Drosophila takahashii]|uniref:moonshiner n=1 Tax=Drosophila takahashii TaxID=29030 RepID=UPI001CF84A8B|nr:moonshiner [Drosophila takahashii]
MAGRLSKLLPTDGVFIPESRRFPQELMASVMEGLRDDLGELSLGDRKSLEELHRIWSGKMANRLPESNPRPPSPKKRRLRGKKNDPPAKSPAEPPEEEREERNVFEIDDDEIVTNRICVPRKRSHWKLRYFDIKMPAYVLKRGLLNEHFNWEILEGIMSAPDEEATAMFQQFVDDVVKDLTP